MSFLENLKSIFNINIDLSKLKSFKINFFSGNRDSQLIKIENKTININVNGVSDTQKPILLQAIKDAVEDESSLLIENQANKLLSDISKEENGEEYKELIEFFRGKIKNSDLEILRAALFIKSKFDQREQIGDLKHDVIIKFGDRGRNIVNLCTAGYFTSILKPLYIEMVNNPSFTPDWFEATFDKIVNTYPFAIFVSSQMTSVQLSQNVESQMKINKKYGIDYLNLHAIGEHNVDKIGVVLANFKSKFKYPPDIESGRRYIIVTIYF